MEYGIYIILSFQKIQYCIRLYSTILYHTCIIIISYCICTICLVISSYHIISSTILSYPILHVILQYILNWTIWYSIVLCRSVLIYNVLYNILWILHVRYNIVIYDDFNYVLNHKLIYSILIKINSYGFYII